MDDTIQNPNADVDVDIETGNIITQPVEQPSDTSEEGRDTPEQDLDDGDEEQRGRVDEELAAANSDAEREQIRQQRRERRSSQRERMRDKNRALERELANERAQREDLARRVAAMETGNVNNQYALLTQHQAEAENMQTELKRIISEATVKGDGNTVANATEALMEVRQRAQLLANAKAQMEQQAQRPQRQQINPAAQQHAQAFVAEHSWYKGDKSNDLDSQVLARIDADLTAKGWDASQPGYWEELRERGAQYLPHRFGAKRGSQGQTDAYNGATQRPQPRSPVAGASSAVSEGAGKKTFRFTPEQVNAMKQAGYWDDPVKRAKMAQRYRNQG